MSGIWTALLSTEQHAAFTLFQQLEKIAFSTNGHTLKARAKREC